jgi:hypothetical protein
MVLGYGGIQKGSVITDLLQLWRRDLIGWFDAPAHAFGFGSFQVAAIRTGSHPEVRRERRSVYCTASLLVCLELKPNAYDYRTRLPSISKLQDYFQ